MRAKLNFDASEIRQASVNKQGIAPHVLFEHADRT